MKKKILLILVFSIFLFPNKVLAQQEEVIFSKCVDGDTAKFIINGKVYSTRFLAIDTPETKHPKKKVEPFGKEASNYTCKRLKEAKKITLEYDDDSPKEDKYGRRLAWIFVDDSLLQKELIKKGYAKVAYLYGEYKYTNTLKMVEKKSKINKNGIWSNNKNESSIDAKLSINEILKKLYQYVRKEIKSML